MKRKNYKWITLIVSVIVFALISIWAHVNANTGNIYQNSFPIIAGDDMEIVYQDGTRIIAGDDMEIVYQDGTRIIARKQTPEGIKYAIIDEIGNQVTPFIYDKLIIEPFLSDVVVAIVGAPWIGGFSVRDRGGTFGFLNWDGSIRLPIEYAVMVQCVKTPDRLILVNNEWKYGIATLDGNVILPAIHHNIIPRGEGLFEVINSEFYAALVDKYGSFLSDFIFSSIGNFSEGLAAVRIGGLMGFINRYADIVIPVEFAAAYYEFQFGYVRVQKQCGEFITLRHPFRN